MRILYLHQYFGSPASAAGTRSYEFARRLIANGHDVCVITSAAMLPNEYKALEKITHVEIEGIPVIVIPVPYGNEMSFSARIRAFLKFAMQSSVQAMRQPADVVFATSTPLTIAIPGILSKLWQHVPMVFEVRDLWPELPIAVGALKNPVFRGLARALEWIAYRAATHVIALSPGMAEGVIRRGIPPARVTVIPNSCDISLFDVPVERGQPIRSQLGLAPDQPLILYAGTFGLINGVGYLVDVAAAAHEIAPDMRFLLVGGGAERGQVEAKARALGVLDRNLWLWDSIPKQELVNVLAAATVVTSLFLPLRPMWNNSANKFFDALAAGKPVAINYGGWQADLLGESGAGIVLPQDDPVQAARDLVALARDSEQLHRASHASRALARTQFDRDLMAVKFEAVLLEAAEW